MRDLSGSFLWWCLGVEAFWFMTLFEDFIFSFKENTTNLHLLIVAFKLSLNVFYIILL